MDDFDIEKLVDPGLPRQPADPRFKERLLCESTAALVGRSRLRMAALVLAIGLLATGTFIGATLSRLIPLSGVRTEEKKEDKKITLRLVDANGQPVAGAKVSGYTANHDGDVQWFYQGGPDVPGDLPGCSESDEDGRVVFRYQDLFGGGNGESGGPVMLVYALDKSRCLAGFCIVSDPAFRGDFPKQGDGVLVPACRLHGRISSSAMEAMGRPLQTIRALLQRPFDSPDWYTAGRRYPLRYESQHGQFEFLVPPGPYTLQLHGTDADGAQAELMTLKFELPAGRKELDLGAIDLPASPMAGLFGKPAPELTGTQPAKRQRTIRLTDFRGKVILLHLGWYRSPRGIRSIAPLMDLHDRYKDTGLVIIAGDEERQQAWRKRNFAGWKEKYWGGRDFPFLTIVDTKRRQLEATYGWGGYEYESRPMDRDGVRLQLIYGPAERRSFVTLLIDRQGVVRKSLDVFSPTAKEVIEQFLHASD